MLCCCCESSSMWMGKGMRCDVQALVPGENLASCAHRFVSHFCLDASRPARSLRCLSCIAGTSRLPSGNAQTRGVGPAAWELRLGVSRVLVQACRCMLLPSQQTSSLEIRSGPLYLKSEKSKNVQKFSIAPSPVSVCDLPQVRLVLHSQGVSSKSTRQQTEWRACSLLLSSQGSSQTPRVGRLCPTSCSPLLYVPSARWHPICPGRCSPGTATTPLE